MKKIENTWDIIDKREVLRNLRIKIQESKFKRPQKVKKNNIFRRTKEGSIRKNEEVLVEKKNKT